MNQPSAIITSDIGLQEGQPICRLDNYWNAQSRKIKWLHDLQNQYGCPIFDGGDVFEHWKPSPYLLRWALEHLPENIITVPGNHDLPAHNLDLYDKSGLAVLEWAGQLFVLKEDEPKVTAGLRLHGFPWGSELKPLAEEYKNGTNVALVHAMAYAGKNPWPGCTDPDALTLLKKMKGYDLIIVGHNHQPFIVEYQGRKLISPGSLTRTTVEQMDYKPAVWLWYAETNKLEAIPVPIEEGVISREHINIVEHKDERLMELVYKLGGDYKVTLSYEDNLHQRIAKAKLSKAVQNKIWGAVHGI